MIGIAYLWNVLKVNKFGWYSSSEPTARRPPSSGCQARSVTYWQQTSLEIRLKNLHVFPWLIKTGCVKLQQTLKNIWMQPIWWGFDNQPCCHLWAQLSLQPEWSNNLVRLHPHPPILRIESMMSMLLSFVVQWTHPPPLILHFHAFSCACLSGCPSYSSVHNVKRGDWNSSQILPIRVVKHFTRSASM